jgi:hypothetical protein
MVVEEDIPTQEVEETTVDAGAVYLDSHQYHKTQDESAANKVILSAWAAVSADNSY